MLKQILFYLVVFVTNIIQGITGFAGTILAMPPSVMLVGFDTAKPILNVLGILAGVYVVFTSYKYINIKEFLKINVVMIFGIVAGIFIKSAFSEHQSVLYKILGVIVILVGLEGMYKTFKPSKEDKPQNKYVSGAMLITSGVVHGMFVCGGPLLVGYLTGKLKDKHQFRATISAVWVVLNSIIMCTDIYQGYFTKNTLKLLPISVICLVAGMFVGNKLYAKMSRELFMKITYVLLIISGISLFIK